MKLWINKTMKVIVDVDGSVCEYIYDDESILNNPELMTKKLAGLKPFVSITHLGIFSNPCRFIFITARRSPQHEMTKEWINKHLTSNFDITFVEYGSKEIYLANKINAIKVAKGSDMAIIIEDDIELIERLKACLDNCVIFRIHRKKGNIEEIIII